MKVSASILVATAERGSIPNWSMAGTVISEVLPVTTLTMLVKKKMARSASSWRGVKSHPFFFRITQ
jgi:hypothetical protein